MTWPYYEFEVHEVIPYEKSGKILGEEVFKFPAEAAKWTLHALSAREEELELWRQ